MGDMIRLMLTRKTADRYEARLNGVLIVTSHRPLFDGARALQKLGYGDDALLTIRHVGAGHDSFDPTPIGRLAALSTTESGNVSLRRTKWVPNPMFGALRARQ